VRELWVATDLDDASVVDEILELAREMRITVREVSRNKMAAEARTDAPQGVLAKAAPLDEVELMTSRGLAASGARPFLIVPDGVTDPATWGRLAGAVRRRPASSCLGIERCT
jgi:23S rRNA (guanosine2251-2'-O)-methyltransferase